MHRLETPLVRHSGISVLPEFLVCQLTCSVLSAYAGYWDLLLREVTECRERKQLDLIK